MMFQLKQLFKRTSTESKTTSLFFPGIFQTNSQFLNTYQKSCNKSTKIQLTFQILGCWNRLLEWTLKCRRHARLGRWKTYEAIEGSALISWLRDEVYYLMGLSFTAVFWSNFRPFASMKTKHSWWNHFFSCIRAGSFHRPLSLLDSI